MQQRCLQVPFAGLPTANYLLAAGRVVLMALLLIVGMTNFEFYLQNDCSGLATVVDRYFLSNLILAPNAVSNCTHLLLHSLSSKYAYMSMFTGGWIIVQPHAIY